MLLHISTTGVRPVINSPAGNGEITVLTYRSQSTSPTHHFSEQGSSAWILHIVFYINFSPGTKRASTLPFVLNTYGWIGEGIPQKSKSLSEKHSQMMPQTLIGRMKYVQQARPARANHLPSPRLMFLIFFIKQHDWGSQSEWFL